ncbi:MAG: two-component sensor histidine kinase [Myxococcaceae bacterium]|nr:two-component sensor histidine kinase [Myxococcaceae bacterium]
MIARDAGRPEPEPRLVAPARAHPAGQAEPLDAGPSAAKADVLDELRAHLRTAHGVDVTGHRAELLSSQLAMRMAVRQIESAQTYFELLDGSVQESATLLESLLIGSTRFFRDLEVFSALADRVLRRVIDPNTRAELRIWAVGCSTGEEAYSLAMLVAEYLEQHGEPRPVRIFATDLRAAALRRAREGVYGESSLEPVSPARRARFFTPHQGGFQVRQSLRDMVLFGQHDLLHSPPYRHIDLVTCRNVLIYLEPVAQRRALQRLHYALRPEGALVLGASESALMSEDLFAPLDESHRFYGKRYSRVPPRGLHHLQGAPRWTSNV